MSDAQLDAMLEEKVAQDLSYDNQWDVPDDFLSVPVTEGFNLLTTNSTAQEMMSQQEAEEFDLLATNSTAEGMMSQQEAEEFDLQVTNITAEEMMSQQEADEFDLLSDIMPQLESDEEARLAQQRADFHRFFDSLTSDPIPMPTFDGGELVNCHSVILGISVDYPELLDIRLKIKSLRVSLYFFLV